MLLPGILRSAKPLNFVRSMCNKHILPSSPIMGPTCHQKVIVTVKRELTRQCQNLDTNTWGAFLAHVRHVSVMPLKMAKAEDVKKAINKEVKKEAEKIIKENVDKNVEKLAKDVRGDGTKVKAAAVLMIEEKKEDPDYSKIYNFRHLISVCLLPVVPICLIGNSPATDYLFVIFIFLHNHFSFETVINDYINADTFGEAIPKISQIFSLVVSVFILIGLVNVIQNDIGIAQTFHCLWRVGKKDIEDERERVQKELEEAAKKLKK